MLNSKLGLFLFVLFPFHLFYFEQRAIAFEVPGYSIELKGKLKVNHPGYLNILNSSQGLPQLIISSFSVFGEDTVKVADHLKEYFLNLSNITPQLLTNKITWPNEVQWIGPEFLGRAGWLVSGGFLVPGRSDGAITFIDEQTHEITELTRPKSGYFYHRTQFVHWGPGQSLAILTARVKKPLNPFEMTKSELVLLYPAQKGLRLSSAPFIQLAEKVIVSGPDAFFQAKDLDGDGVEELVAAQFFSKKLMLYWWEEEKLKSRVLDQGNTAFDLVYGDLAGNGNLALVVSNHESSDFGSVVAYEVPNSFKTDPWKKHFLLKNIKTRHTGFNQAAPGSPLIFFPDSSKKGKSWILISGDASEKGHLLIANSEDSDNWDYTENIILNSTSTIGQAAAADVDGDGNTEIFIPAYDLNEVYCYTVRPRQIK